jgi:hypothetical protein
MPSGATTAPSVAVTPIGSMQNIPTVTNRVGDTDTSHSGTTIQQGLGTDANTFGGFGSLKSHIYDRIIALNNFPTVAEAQMYYNTLSPEDKFNYVSFDRRSRDYIILTQNICGYQSCPPNRVLDFSLYSDVFLRNLSAVMNDYLRVADIAGTHTINDSPTASDATALYTALYANKGVPSMSDQAWWNWYTGVPVEGSRTVCVPVFNTSPTGLQNQNTLYLFLYSVKTFYMINSARTIPDLYMIKNIRDLLTSKKQFLSSDTFTTEFTNFLQSCRALDPMFSTNLNPDGMSYILTSTAALYENVPKVDVTLQTTPAFRYFQYKAGFSIGGLRQLFLDVVEVHDCIQLIQGIVNYIQIHLQSQTLPVALHDKIFTTLNTTASLILSDITQNMYIWYSVIVDVRNLQQAIKSTQSLCEYLHITDQAQIANIGQNVLPLVTAAFNSVPTTPGYVNYDNLRSYFSTNSLPDDDAASWTGWIQLLNHTSIQKGNRTSADNATLKQYLCSQTCTDPKFLSMQNLVTDNEKRILLTTTILNTAQVAKFLLYILTIFVVITVIYALQLQSLTIQIGKGMFLVIVVILLLVYGYDYYSFMNLDSGSGSGTA